MSTVALEETCLGKLAEAMSNHVFRGVDAHEILAVVNQEGVTDKIGSDHGTTCPCLYRALQSGVVELVHFVEQCLLDEGSFFQ